MIVYKTSVEFLARMQLVFLSFKNCAFSIQFKRYYLMQVSLETESNIAFISSLAVNDSYLCWVLLTTLHDFKSSRHLFIQSEVRLRPNLGLFPFDKKFRFELYQISSTEWKSNLIFHCIVYVTGPRDCYGNHPL